MKKVIRSIAVVALMIATTTGMAKEPKLVTDGTSKSVSFEWETQLLNTSLKIYDENGVIVHSDYIKNAEDYARRFDLTPLKEGMYFLKIQNGTKEMIYSLRLNTDNVAILGIEENNKPAFRRKDGRVYMNYLNAEIDAVEVRVTDANGNLLFEETFEDIFVVEKAFNFKEAFKGDYTIAVTTSENAYYETVSIK